MTQPEQSLGALPPAGIEVGMTADEVEQRLSQNADSGRVIWDKETMHGPSVVPAPRVVNWTNHLLLILAECPFCSALVMDSAESKQNHWASHNGRSEP